MSWPEPRNEEAFGRGPRIDVPWGAGQALWGLAGLAGVWAVAIAALALLIAISGTAEEVTPPVWAVLGATFVLQVGTVGVGYRLGPHGRGDPVLLLGLRRLDTYTLWKWAAAGFLASLAASVTFVTIAERVSSDLVPPPLPEELASGDLKLLTFLSIVLIAPMAEELFFRGFLFAGLLRRFGPWGAGAISAAAFATTHLDVALLGPAFLGGSVFAWLYWRTGSLWPAILAHTSQNAIAFGLAF